MLIPRIVRVKRAIVDRLRTLTPASGAQYAFDVREFDESSEGESESPVQADVVFAGIEPTDDQAISHSDVWMQFDITVTCTKRLANEDNPVDEVAITASADVWKALMDQGWFQGTAECQNVRFEGLEVIANPSYYGIGCRFGFLVTFDEDDPFSR